jgi:hypothetical protein
MNENVTTDFTEADIINLTTRCIEKVNTDYLFI